MVSKAEVIERGIEVNVALAVSGRRRLPTDLVNTLLRDVRPEIALEAFDLWLAQGRWTSPAGEDFEEA